MIHTGAAFGSLFKELDSVNVREAGNEKTL